MIKCKNILKIKNYNYGKPAGNHNIKYNWNKKEQAPRTKNKNQKQLTKWLDWKPYPRRGAQPNQKDTTRTRKKNHQTIGKKKRTQRAKDLKEKEASPSANCQHEHQAFCMAKEQCHAVMLQKESDFHGNEGPWKKNWNLWKITSTDLDTCSKIRLFLSF